MTSFLKTGGILEKGTSEIGYLNEGLMVDLNPI